MQFVPQRVERLDGGLLARIGAEAATSDQPVVLTER
jgi:hypothetical protein